MASVFRRKGSPYFYAAYFDADGKRCYRSTKEKRRGAALTAAAEWEASSRRVGEDGESRKLLSILQEATERALRGQLNGTSARGYLERLLEAASGERLYDPSIEEWFRGWLEEKTKSKTAGTAARYKVVVDQFLYSLPAKKRKNSLSSLSIEDVRLYRDQLLEGGRTSVTANSAIKILRVPLNVARKQGILVHNPAEGVEMLAKDEVTKDVFTPDQVRRLVAAAEGDWKGLILAGYYTGGRISDLACMKWDGIDLKGGVISFVQGKTKQPIHIPIHQELKKWLKQVPKQDRHGPVFQSLASSAAAGPSGLSWQFRQLMGLAGIQGTVTDRKGAHGKKRYSLSFHSLRHSFNSAMANAGVSQEIRQRLTGHASKAINDRYTHSEFEVLKKAVQKVPGLEDGDS